MCHSARITGTVVPVPVREQKRAVLGQGLPRLALLVVALPVLGEHLDGCRVDREPAHLVGLGVLLDRPAAYPHVVPPHGHDAGVEVDVGPAQREQLGSAHPGHHHEPDQGSPVVVLSPRGVDDPRRLRDGGRVGLRRRLAWLPREDGGVVRDPAPALGRGQHATDGEVDTADRRGSERPAGVRATLDDPAACLHAVVGRIAGCRGPARRALVLHGPALVRLARSVLDPGPAVAARAAAAELGVELLQQLCRHATDWLVAERR